MAEAEVVQLFDTKELTCCRCKLSKPLSCFNKITTKKRGYSYACKDCINTDQKNRYKAVPLTQENKERIAEITKQRHAKKRQIKLDLLNERGEIVCAKCNESKHFDEFTVDSRRYTGHRAQCKSCSNGYYAANMKKYVKANKEKLSPKVFWYYRKSTHGVTSQQYMQMLIEQNGCCAICKKKPEKVLCIDHNHVTKEIRGLLCHRCNAALGMLKDSITICMNAVQYLTERGSYG